MSAKKAWTREQAENALNQIAESIKTAKPSEIEEEVRASGEDLESILRKMNGAIQAGIKQFRQKRLHEARRHHSENLRKIELRERRIASNPEARRTQFFALLQTNPGVQSALTMQHRDLNALTVADIESALEELDALGAIEDLGQNPDEPGS